MGYYVHHVPGRLRVRAPLIGRCPARANDLKARIEALPGVREAEVNKHASCVIVQYDAKQLDADSILDALKTEGCLEQNATIHRPQAAMTAGEIFGKAVFDVFVAKTIERSVLSLVAAFR